MTTKKTIKSAFESMMFVWGEPLDVKTAADVFDISWKEAYDCFLELKQEYEQEGRGIRIIEINKTFQFITNGDNAPYIERLCTPVKEKKLSQSALEVLAIIAYKQPITKGEIDSIRGIKCDRVIEGLLKKELIQEKGRSNGIGRPILYGTTDAFLGHFGFENIRDLPDIENIESAVTAEDPEDEVYAQQIKLDF
ncbi:SMC-Scp complex subunit ScpB [Aminipila butyrica]|uniref:Segregation and condensation protein B n=1 Tax=Aminipila butyrica TaxID=433296 RepID=A0A858BYQ5_9FIRM|nr:SMC-Scp complex subunit ScpB [Aminipila butyrica]QIB70582.1 SMC-Scp complex subunit ScpB [Aminipila butyrica]